MSAQTQVLRIRGRDIPVPLGLTAREVLERIQLNNTHVLAYQNQPGASTEILDIHSPLPSKSKLDLDLIPRYEQGFDSRLSRIDQEAKILSYHYYQKN